MGDGDDEKYAISPMCAGEARRTVAPWTPGCTRSSPSSVAKHGCAPPPRLAGRGARAPTASVGPLRHDAGAFTVGASAGR
jgi:hypothetical protein